VQIRGAVIEGALDFEGCTLATEIHLHDCELTDTLTLLDASTRTVDLGGSLCHDIHADGVEIRGDLFLHDSFVARGVVRLLGAKITSTLECYGSRFEGRDDQGVSLQCDGMQVGGDVPLSEGIHVHGEVKLVGATIGGDVVCTGGTFGTIRKEEITQNDSAKVSGNGMQTCASCIWPAPRGWNTLDQR